MLQGFFEGWPNLPPPDTHLAMLRGSAHVWLALDGGQVAGFVNAVSDGVLSAYIPLLEVLPEYRGRGVGTQLMRHMLQTLGQYYMADVLCDPDIVPFYTKLGMSAATGAVLRNYARQNGT